MVTPLILKMTIKKYLDKIYKNEIVHPMTRTVYWRYVNKLHREYIDNYVQPLWENLLNDNFEKSK